jgi:small subunit ribosomal protein S4
MPEIVLQLLETRLDILVYRLRFASTLFGAQQLVSHGHVLVNGKRANCRSYQIKPGMVVSIRNKSKQCKMIIESMKNTHRSIPGYLELNDAEMSGVLLAPPAIESIPLPLEINMPMVCDFLAHGG